MAHVTTYRTDGQDFDITVDGGGMFRAYIDEDKREEVAARSLDELKAHIDKMLKKRKAFKPIEITLYHIQPVADARRHYGSFKYEKGHGRLDVILRGYSDHRRALLVTLEDGSKAQVDDYTLKEQVARRFSEAEDHHYDQLVDEVKKAQAALDEFLKARRIDVKALASGEAQ